MKHSEPLSLLEQLIRQLTLGRDFSISIHDASGMLHANPVLALSPPGYSHNNPFCSTAKLTSRGFKNCLRCKALTLKKASEQQTPFWGHCYLGQWEWIHPVCIQDKLVCVIYISHLMHRDALEASAACIRRNAPRTGANTRKLLGMLPHMEMFSEGSLPEYREKAHLIARLITTLLRTSPDPVVLRSDPAPIFRGDIHSAVRIVADYISVHFSLDIHLEQLAKICFLNPGYLSRLFRQETGTSLTEYLNFVRIRHARDLLVLTDDDILSISMLVGYNSDSYFCRVFKRATGLSPSAYRDQHRHLPGRPS